MSILTASDLGLSHGAFDVFSGISLEIPDMARIGLIGANGIGKTSLLRILGGISPPSSGTVSLARGRRVGYLRQEAQEVLAGRGHSIFTEMLSVFDDLRAQGAQLRLMEERMSAGELTEGLLEEYGALQHAFEEAGGYTYEVRIKQVLDGLGFAAEQWELPVNHLSGGQKTRLLLARLLLEAPDLLILDEPTNHLDVQAVQWLEGTLRTWNGALLVVSHDRYFLDHVADYIWEMSRTSLEVYRGNYSAYVQQRQERWERYQRVYEEEKERLEKELELIRRYIAWRKFDEARGKQRRLGRELLAIEKHGLMGIQGKSWMELEMDSSHMMSVEEIHERVKAIRPPVQRPPKLAMQIKAAPRGGDSVLRAKNLQIGYPGKLLCTAKEIELRRTECAALIGPNGAGKTTFLRTVLGQLPPLAGELRLGAGLKIGYFAQAHERLDAEKTVLDELLSHGDMTLNEARDHLALYLFRGEDVFKKVGMLSGGERGRLALAILTIEHANLLLLDEPTNHLDIPAQEVLQEVLERFAGTLLLVSHDRYLIERLATQIWEIRDGRLHIFKGNYDEYEAARERETQRQKEAARAESAPARANGNARSGSAATGQRETRKRAETLARLEAEIAEAEAMLARCSHELQEQSEAQRIDEVQRLADAYAATQGRLDELMNRWTELAAMAEAP